MEIKLVKNQDFMELAELYIKMYSSVDPNINAFQAVNTLVALINSQPTFTVIGLYHEDKLVGFVSGHAIGTVFYFSGIYMSIKNTEWSGKLVEYAITLIETAGDYTAWEADTTNSNISSILEKFKAFVKSTKYRKEIN